MAKQRAYAAIKAVAEMGFETGEAKQRAYAAIKDVAETGEAKQRAYAAIKAMAEMGFETGEAKIALEGLLKRTEDNWDYVQDNNYTALVNAIFAIQESGSKAVGTKHSTDSMLLPLPENLRDRKGKRPLIQTEDHCILPKKSKSSVPQSKQGNQQTVSALKSLEMMGFKEDLVMPVLKRLLKESDNNWDYIQHHNYSALVDVILHLDTPNNDNAAISSRSEQQHKGLKIKRAECRQSETQCTSNPPLMTNAPKAGTSQAPISTTATSEASSSSMARGKVGLPVLPQEKRAKRSAANELSEHATYLKRAKIDAPSVCTPNKSVLSDFDPKEEQNDYAELEDHDSIYWPSACDVPMPDEPEGERYMFEEWHRDKLDLFNKAGLIVLGSGEILQKTATHFLNLWSVNNLNKRGIGYNDNQAPDQLPKESPELYQRFVEGATISESQLPNSSHAVSANDIEKGSHLGVVSSNWMVQQANEETQINFNMSFSFPGRKNPRKKNQALAYCFA